MKISVEMQDAELMAALTRLRRKTGNLRDVMDDIASTMQNSVEQNFKEESTRKPIKGRGGVWQDLAPSTKKARAKKGKTGRKLQVTGQLLASLTTQATNDSAMLGTNKKYARFLNDGTKKMPARPFMVIQEADVREFTEQVQDYFRDLR